MRTASRPAWNGRFRSRVWPGHPLDPASQQLERDADATMMVAEGHEYTGVVADPDRRAARREAARLPKQLNSLLTTT